MYRLKENYLDKNVDRYSVLYKYFKLHKMEFLL